jgi:beta-lactamase class A
MIATILLAAAATFALPPQQSDAVIGVAAVNLRTGRRIAVRGNERFPMGSVYKFPIALAVLRQVDTGTLSFEHVVTIEPSEFAPGWSPLRDHAKGKPIALTVRELLRHMVSVSDNTASDALLRLVGGPRVVSARMTELGFATIRIDRSETQMAADLGAPGGVERYAVDERDTTTPNAMADLLIAFWNRRDGLTRESHDLLVELMTHTETGKRRLKSAMPRGAVIAHKTGTMPGTVNDVGVVVVDGATYVIAVFTKAGTSKETLREDDLAAVAKAAVAALR